MRKVSSSSDDKDSDDSNNMFDSKELAFNDLDKDDDNGSSSDDGSDEVPSTQQVSQITE
jgi:hypothetical protein